MSKANLINSLFKIDAAEGFVRYTNTVKPYHSKILDVMIEYIYKEDVRVKVTEAWTTDVLQEKSAYDNCYYRVVNDMTVPGVAGTWYIEGHHQPAFRHGDRFLVTYNDNSSKVFIVDRAQNIEIIEPTDPYLTAITVVGTQTVPDKEATTVQLAFAPNYRIIGATAGDNGQWIVDGNVADEFQVGEKVIIANTKFNDTELSIFTVRSQPTIGYVPGVSLGSVPDYTPDYNIVGVRPTRVTGESTIVPGQWIILGAHGSKIIPGTHFSVSDKSVDTGVYYVVEAVTEQAYNTLPPEVKRAQYSDYLGNSRVTVITINSAQEIPETAQPAGVIQCPVIPAYEIIGNTLTSWIIGGHYAERFGPGDRLFVEGNQLQSANKEYIIASATNSTSGSRKTTIVVQGGISGSANATGRIQHPSAVTTIIPVVERVFTVSPNSGDVYRPFGTGTLRHLPLLIEQIAQPDGNVPIGAVWLNPITNVSKRWNGLGWVHNYTPIAHSWYLDSVTPANLVIKQATTQIADVQDVNYGHSNSFVVDTTNKYKNCTFSVTSLDANQLMFSKSFNIVGVDPTLNKWTVSGVADVYISETIYVTSSSNTQGLGKYIVANVVKGASTTDIYVTKQISRLASADGILSVPMIISDVPHWIEGTRVRVSSTTVLPDPLVVNQPYYFIPVVKPYEVSKDIPSQEAIYNQWYRFSHSNANTFPADTNELLGWEYLSATNTFRSTINSNTTIGMVSPDSYSKYDLEVQLSSVDGDDDAAGVVIAWYRDETTGKENTLTAIRSPGGVGYTWRIVYNLGQSDQWVVSDKTRFIKWGNGRYGQSAVAAGYTANKPLGGWDDFIAVGTRVKIERDGSKIICQTTDMNSTSYVDSAAILVDLTKDSRLTKFIGPRQFGVAALSQRYISFKILALNAVVQETPAVFALSKVRKPRDFYDYVDVTTFGSGVLTLTQDELYVPGTRVIVKDSDANRNDGSYTILGEEPITPTTSRLFVAEHVKSPTPAGKTVDGVIMFDKDTHVFSSLTERACKKREQSELYADTRITEFIQFEFTVEEFDFISARLRENEPYSEFLRELGFDVPNPELGGFDGEGFDGELFLSVNSTANGMGGQAYLHSMIPVGFDTQYFDVGGIDETTATVSKLYNRSV